MRTLTLFTLSIALLLHAGCGGQHNPYDTALVEGFVTLNGEPIEGVNVIFTPRGQTMAAGGITEGNGRFVLTTAAAPAGSGAEPGEYDVTFSKSEVEGRDMSVEEFNRVFAHRAPVRMFIVPERYGNARTSGLEPVTVERVRMNTFRFELTAE
ncbi:MAG: carboxypeptidase-like regulatory domain-containing protein [Planctomycetaceae bacterium]|nr:carboxypeptidase-like regulatory domain-containing protein [Planctomycetaceae bacterium]